MRNLMRGYATSWAIKFPHHIFNIDKKSSRSEKRVTHIAMNIEKYIMPVDVKGCPLSQAVVRLNISNWHSLVRVATTNTVASTNQSKYLFTYRLGQKPNCFKKYIHTYIYL